MREYVVMAIDECGDEYRPYFLEDMKFHFPDFDESEDDGMWEAFLVWEEKMMEKVMERVAEHYPYGWECNPFLEETYESKRRRNGWNW